VRIFNDSKRFEDLKKAVVRLARMGNPGWRRIPEDELLRELNLVANQSYLLMSGSWLLVDDRGQHISLGEFSPSVGFPAAQAAHVERVAVHAENVLCVENLTTFHALASDSRLKNTALLCLAGNPSPAIRRLLRCLAERLPEPVRLSVWADLDYGGFNILAQLRREISARFTPFNMDATTLDQFSHFARPLTLTDRRNLERQEKSAELADLHPLIEYMLKRGIKLEQEAIMMK
jgi:DNA topoisomerase VI subunit A